MKNLPILQGAFEAIEKKLLTRADKSNRIYTAQNIQVAGKIDPNLEHIFYDPQTSGGLLISIPEKFANIVLQELKECGDLNSSIVGWVETPDEKFPEGTVVLHYE
jgi:selenide,water dikinase